MRIAVVGAGFAGLRAAQLLERAGHTVYIYEARDRLGGRARTLKLKRGWVEAGPEWIGADHQRMHDLLAEFDMRAEPGPGPGWGVALGSRFPESDPPSEIAEDLKAFDALIRERAPAFAEEPWNHPEITRLDVQPASDLLDEACVSEAGRAWAEAIFQLDEGAPSSELSVAGYLWKKTAALHTIGKGSFRCPIGLQDLAERMAASLENRPILSRPLRTIRQHPDQVELWLEGEMAFVDRAVIAIPPPCLVEVDFEDALPAERWLAWQMMAMSPARKIGLRMESEYWDKSRLLTDEPWGQAWSGGRDGAVVRTIYGINETSDEDALSALADHEPAAREQCAGGAVFDWRSDPWAQGAYPMLPPGAVAGALPWLGKAWGRVHFIGDATAKWMGFMEGAVESAERVVEEIAQCESGSPDSDPS